MTDDGSTHVADGGFDQSTGATDQIPDECITCGGEPIPAGNDCWECPDCGLTGCGISGCEHGGGRDA